MNGNSETDYTTDEIILKKLAFIPARAGSKRLPGKNIRLLNGIPLIAYSIEYAKRMGIEKIVVSTDGKDIADISSSFGAIVIERPNFLSTDTATTADAARHALECVMNDGFSPDVFITLQPTNPLRPKELLDQCLKVYEQSQDTTILTVCKNKHKLGSLCNGKFVAEHYVAGERSQDLKSLFYENGLIYLSRPYQVMQGRFFGKEIEPVEVDDLYGLIDIDEELDFRLTEFVLSEYGQNFSYLFE